MALVSPGNEVTIIDESQYDSTLQNTVPYIVMVTAENKLDPAGTSVAEGTLASNADNMYLITSQRELVNTFGEPYFYKTSAGNSVHGHELNEYGLMAAYSLLGVTNRVYIQRADIDLAQLEASLVRPIGDPANGTYWYDLAESVQGYFEWDNVNNAFTAVDMIIINDLAELVGGLPSTSVGTIGSYAVVTANANNPVYTKNKNNEWVLVGSDNWKATIPVVIGSNANPTITGGNDIKIDGLSVGVTGPDIQSLATDINNASIPNVTASVVNGKLEIYKTAGDANPAVSSSDVTLTLANGLNTTALGEAGLAEGTFNGIILQHSNHIDVPRWRTTDTSPRPSGSVWYKTTAVNEGAHLVIKKYDASQSAFVEVTAPIYLTDQDANKNLDAGGGGINIATGDLYVQVDVNENDTATAKVFTRTGGATKVVGATAAPTFTIGDQFTIEASVINSSTLAAAVTITMTGTTPADFVADVLAANIPNVTAEVTANNYVQLNHTAGGVIVVEDTVGGALAAAGFSASLDNVRLNYLNQMILSNWNALTYVADSVTPGQDPANGTKWYYSDITEVDIMIHDGGVWKAYQNVTNDIRGFDLSGTNANGPQVAALPPETQEDGTALVYGDLWIDSSDLENYPKLYRWESKDLVDQWIAIDLTDQTSTNGILFADARWAGDGTTDPITDDLPTIVSLLTNDAVDPDAPEAALYPDGMLLWNTRRSGYTVKEFRANYYTPEVIGNFAAFSVDVKDAWVTVSGLREDGAANFGRHAQRYLVTKALKAVVDSSTDAREEQRDFTLMACPGYPELIPNLVSLNNERKNTAFIIGDSPMRLANNANDIIEWATDNNGLGMIHGDGLKTSDEYLGVYYPSGKTNDLSGTSIVVPPSHMIMRTMVLSDEKSYPWIPAAGVRRGVIDNASNIGYIDAITGEFVQILNREGIRDVLYQNTVNPIAVQTGAGIVNYGNLTTKSGSAMDRVNTARLINYIRTRLETISRLFLFEPNDKETRDEFKGLVERMLNDLIGKRAIYDYVVVCDKTNNTNERISRHELWLDMAIEPVKDAEFIYVPVRLKDTGDLSS